jgi:hypothetical protein
MPAADDRGQTPLETLRALLTTAREFAAKFTHDPLVERILAAFARLPEPDRETIVGVIERDATWCRIAEQTADTTGITVRANPQASLYVHVLAPQQETPDEPLRRDVEVIRFGIEQFVRMIPFFFQEGVHAQWTRSARELIAEAEPELRQHTVRLCREVLALIEEGGGGTSRRERTARAPSGAHGTP